MTSVRAVVVACFCVSIAFPVSANANSLALNTSDLRCELSKSKKLDVSAIKVYIYDFTNNINSSYYINAQDSVKKITGAANFNRSSTHFLYVPGFTDTIDGINQKNLLNNMKHYPKTYIYIFDLEKYTGLINSSYAQSYDRAILYHGSLATAVALFIKRLVEGGVPLQNIILVGHSLGGQLVAWIGEAYINETGKKFPRIIGTDPSGPCFTTSPKEYQLRSGVAEFTETYHCNKGTLGTTADFTDASYYVNGGSKQPGCKALNSFTGSNNYLKAMEAAGCNHNQCHLVLTTTARIAFTWTAKKCNSVSDCEKGVTENNGTTYAKIRSPLSNRGIYFIDTNGYNLTAF